MADPHPAGSLTPIRVRLVESAAAELRLAQARQFVEQRLDDGDVLLVGASRGSVDDFARSIAASRGATLGLHRFSLTQLAARLAAPVLANDGLAPASSLGSEAVAARAAFDALTERALRYFAPVAGTPGFPKALARTLQELRLAEIEGGRLGALPLGGADLAVLLERFEEQFAAASATDRAALFAAATDALRQGNSMLRTSAIVLLDVPLDSPVEFAFVKALLTGPSASLLTVPFGDVATLARLKTIGIEPEILEQDGPSDLAALRASLFSRRQPAPREPAGDVRVFSAPGEGRECVEIVRRILQEAASGVRFDEMAVLLRAPQRYIGLLEHALKRARVPAYFDRGTQRPHPAGRAFLAILACACEKLSARRFAEYLSLAQVPGRAEGLDDSGTLRAPWKWETLIVESAVIGGDPARWHRRLDGLANRYRIQIAEERKEDPESAKAARIGRDLENLSNLRAFVLPIVDRLAAWPTVATWGEWLDLFSELAPQVLRQPDRVEEVLRKLRPMSAIGPVPLDEARDVLADRLSTLELEPPHSRYGRVFVGSPHQARGRVFRVVFVAGLAERLFPQRPHEDPMLLDREMRGPLEAGLVLQEDRARTERLLLRLAVGAAADRLWLSYPRLEMAESRPRVPSFYALDVMRAITGRVPRHEALQESAAAEGGAGLAWPAPADPSAAIDDLEHDLAVLKRLLQIDPPSSVRGHAHYLLRLNECLKRSVSARWARGRSQWTPFDGITRVTGTTAPMLARQRLGARPYSLSALQKFASCPYQFLLSAIYRLEPTPEIEPLQKLDPLTRGSIFHECQATFYRALQAEGRLPLAESGLPHALATLDAVVAEVAAKYEEDLAPAIPRVWRDEVGDIARDLRVWVRRSAAAAAAPEPPPELRGSALAGHGAWEPIHFEFAFGLHDEDRDPASVADPVLLDGRFLLRGSVDLIERRRDTNLGTNLEPRTTSLAPPASVLRVTDHKTGRNRAKWNTVIGGGSILQPVLYSLAVEAALKAKVHSGRLFYCTSAGGFVEHEIPINETSRRSGLEALAIIDRAIELGFLPAAPDEKACTWCDFRTVCGPDEYERVRRKMPEKLGDLEALRERP